MKEGESLQEELCFLSSVSSTGPPCVGGSRGCLAFTRLSKGANTAKVLESRETGWLWQSEL